jgi:DNA-binding CsgD family transcriptional regulator
MPELKAVVAVGLPTGGITPSDLVDIEALCGSAAAAFAVDLEDRIVYWNRGAERFFGWRAEETLGKRGFEVLGGHDAFGNRYCGRRCPVRRAVEAGAELQPFAIDLCARDASHKRIRIRMRNVPEEVPRLLLHLLDAPPFDELFEGLKSHARRPAPGPAQPHGSPLTARERQVLALLAEGLAAQGAAERLGISHATVRNHIQNILRKIEVHGQVEAVAVALRSGWI